MRKMVKLQMGVILAVVLILVGVRGLAEEAQSGSPDGKDADRASDALVRKLNETILPKVDFEDATIKEALDFFHRQSIEQGDEKGVDFVMKEGAGDDSQLITMRLNDVPLVEALNYATDFAGLSYRVDAFAVVVGKDLALEMITRSFSVPKNFVTMFNYSGDQNDDPFAAPSESENTEMIPTVSGFLSRQGITYPEGACVIYDRKNSKLIVRNTLSNLELIEAYVATIYDHLPSVLRMRLELYELSNQEALDLLAKTDAARSKESEVGESDFEEIVTMKEWVSERRARLRGSASIVGRSGQRVKVESGKGIEFVSGYDEREGKDVPRRERVVQGIVFECDPVIGADGYTVEMNVSVETGFGKPTISKQKVVGPASGIEREVERVSISTQAISTAVTLYSGETRLIGCLPSVKEDGQTSVLVFLTATVANP